MEFADASLVALAEERVITEIVTLDKKDFQSTAQPDVKGSRLCLSNVSGRIKRPGVDNLH